MVYHWSNDHEWLDLLWTRHVCQCHYLFCHCLGQLVFQSQVKTFDADGLRNQFPGVERITNNYSQADQDIFVLSLLNGKRQGTYLEIGCGWAFDINNTALLETKFDWRGISIDTSPMYQEQWTRQNPMEVVNGLHVDYLELLQRHGITTGIIDYLSIDCDPPDQTFAILKRIPLDKLKFAVITFEHDCYAHGSKIKEASRQYLQSHGYELVVSNISCQGLSIDFEDWWAHPDLVDRALIDQHQDLRDIVKDYSWYLYNRLPTCLQATTWAHKYFSPK